MEDDLLRRAGRAVVWSALARWLDAGASLVSLFVVVRVLGPEVYGLFGMVMIALALPAGIVGGPLAESLIQHPNVTRRHEAATFLAELSVSIGIGLILVLSAPLVAGIFQRPDLQPLILAMSIAPFLSSLGATPCALLQRDLRFRAIGFVDAIGAISAAIAAIVLVASGFGVWSLVVMELLRRTVRSVGFWIVARWRLTVRASWSDFRELAHFNSFTIATKLLAQAETAIPGAVIGTMLGPQALGYYNLASRLFTQSANVLLMPLHAVTLPVVSSSQGEPQVLRRVFTQGLRLSTAIAYPYFIGAAVAAPVFVPLFFGDSWDGTVLIVQLMMLLGIRAATASFNGGVIRGAGRPATQSAIVALSLALSLVVLPVVAPYGLAALIIAILLRGLVTWLAGAVVLKDIMQLSIFAQVTVGWPSLAASLVMAGAVMVILRTLGDTHSPWLVLPLVAVVGVLSYAAALAVIAPKLVGRVLDFVRRKNRGVPPVDVAPESTR